MSGGSMGYLYQKVEVAEFRDNTTLRRALRAHLTTVAAALRAIEWNDSGDGADDENALIIAVIGEGAVLDQAIEEAKQAKWMLDFAMDMAKRRKALQEKRA